MGARLGLPWLMTLGGFRTVGGGGALTWGLLNSEDLLANASDMLGDCGAGVVV